MERIFWLDKWEGKAQGGYFIRNGLFEFFKKMEEQSLKPVGIKVDDSWNLEIIVEAPERTPNEKGIVG